MTIRRTGVPNQYFCVKAALLIPFGWEPRERTERDGGEKTPELLADDRLHRRRMIRSGLVIVTAPAGGRRHARLEFVG